MDGEKKTVNIMAVGLKRSEIRGLKHLFSSNEKSWSKYCLKQWESFSQIDIMLIAPDNNRVLLKWRELSSRNHCPETIFVCDKDTDIEDTDILLNACFRPVSKAKLLEALTNVRPGKTPGEIRQKRYLEAESYQRLIAA